MDNTIKYLLTLNYDECCNFLKQKYGLIDKPYFVNDSFKSVTSSIKRTKDGLCIHHIDEDKAIMLSTREYAMKNPFEYQLGPRLVYCNLLEHLVLHIKILQYPHPNKNPNELVGVGGIFNFIIPELNDIYSGIVYKLEWKNNIANVVKNQKSEYLECIKYLMSNFNFDIKLFLSSYSSEYGIWNINNNKAIFSEILQMYKNLKTK